MVGRLPEQVVLLAGREAHAGAGSAWWWVVVRRAVGEEYVATRVVARRTRRWWILEDLGGCNESGGMELLNYIFLIISVSVSVSERVYL